MAPIALVAASLGLAAMARPAAPPLARLAPLEPKVRCKLGRGAEVDARLDLHGLTQPAAWRRIRRLEAAGVIQGYTVRINPQALDLADTVLVQVTLDSHSDNTLEKFGETLASIPEVIEAHLVSGDYDYLLRIVVKDTRDYERLLREKLYKIKGIRHSQSSFVLRTLKHADLPLGV